eukprot:NODE_499_length_6752_cov_0.698482.p5 type:complete len:139 gc:universal NODE_499_length_6752_cov_0.698482:3592-3176(-)
MNRTKLLNKFKSSNPKTIENKDLSKKRHINDAEVEEVETESQANKLFRDVDYRIMRSNKVLKMNVTNIEMIDKGYILLGEHVVLIYRREQLFDAEKRRKLNNESHPAIGDNITINGFEVFDLCDGDKLILSNTHYIDF